MLFTDHFKTRFENRINNDLRLLIKTLEELLQSSNDNDDQKYIELKNKAADILEEIKLRANEMSENYCFRTKEVINYADDYIRNNPWKGVGISGIAGLLVGFFLIRK